MTDKIEQYVDKPRTVIHKFTLRITDALQSIECQGYPEVLSVQRGIQSPGPNAGFMDEPPEILLWALVDLRQPVHYLNIRMHGTGNPMLSHPGKHLATLQIRGFVWHYFLEAVGPISTTRPGREHPPARQNPGEV